MATKHQKFSVKISEKYTKEERLAIAQDIIDYVINRTTGARRDKNNKPFTPGYTEQYAQQTDGKSTGETPDLQLSGEMLEALKMTSTAKGRITIGFDRGSKENAKADGNVRGTYGQHRPGSARARELSRDFMGISSRDLREVLRDYPLRSKDGDAAAKRKERVDEVLS